MHPYRPARCTRRAKRHWVAAREQERTPAAWHVACSLARDMQHDSKPGLDCRPSHILDRVVAIASELHATLQAAQRECAAILPGDSDPGPGTSAFVSGVLERYAELTQLDAQLDAAQRRVVIRQHRALVQPLFFSVPVIRRSVDRPLGYPGDYRMVETIFYGEPRPDLPLAALLERVVLECAPSLAHRYRAPWAHGWLQRKAQDVPEPLRVLSFACGPERILRQHAEQGARMDAMLCDHDPRALAHAKTGLAAALADRGSVSCVELSAVQLIRRDPHSLLQGPFAHGFDAVLVLGLFDYLRDGLIARMLRRFCRLLRPGGLLLASNLDRRNPHRAFMEYVGDWHVLHRDRAEFEALMLSAPGLQALELTTDPTETNLLFAGRVNALA
jgi:extracellular factor (EF) 3-hydroxypalmitic acid methyl ester biosynthesis protein